MSPSAGGEPARLASPVIHLLAAGGTIAMQGRHAEPALDATALAAAVPGLAAYELRTETVRNLPGALLGLDDALELARAAAGAAADGDGVVVTHGTDTLEETAFLCDLVHDGEAPVVFTGAIRPASDPGADGPANLLAAAAVAAEPAARGLGTIVCFGGELHAARWVRKVRTTSPLAFGSPACGSIGWVDEERVTVALRPVRFGPLAPANLDARVPVLAFGLGDRGEAVAAVADGAEGLVAVLLGAGHAHPDLLAALDDVAAAQPVVAAVRPVQGRVLHETYGFPGSERDLRASRLVPAGALSPAAARMLLLAALGAGLDGDGIRRLFAERGAA
jgi:L-asparaginase